MTLHLYRLFNALIPLKAKKAELLFYQGFFKTEIKSLLLVLRAFSLLLKIVSSPDKSIVLKLNLLLDILVGLMVKVQGEAGKVL